MGTFRILSVLELIPINPQSFSTQKLQQKLIERGFDISTRMLQRDLQSLYEQVASVLKKIPAVSPMAGPSMRSGEVVTQK
ncbi:hypothetical protein [Pseudoalteromonas sp. ZZD1]|uniref:hypothetical protein n=1 Tax=Pseudoalteromonas sp. ZZD1 TaxID=3139395 RepID=UPI003BAB7B6B